MVVLGQSSPIPGKVQIDFKNSRTSHVVEPGSSVKRTTTIGHNNKTSNRMSNIVYDQLRTSVFNSGQETEVNQESKTNHKVSLSRKSAAPNNSTLKISVKSSRDVTPPTLGSIKRSNQSSKLIKSPSSTAASSPISLNVVAQNKETPLTKRRQTEEHKKSQKTKIQETHRLGVLSERRPKESMFLTMQLKRACLGFEAFSIVIKYLTDELDTLSKPRTLTEIKKTQADIYKAENRLLALNYEKKLRILKTNHEEEVRDLKNIHVKSIRDVQTRNKAALNALREQHNRIIEDMEKDFTIQLQQAEESHKRTWISLQDKVAELKKQCKDLQHETKYIESTLQQDPNSKLRLEKLPIARQQIQKLKARIEDLQAVVDEKVRIERQLATESQHLKEEFEKESKTNSRLSMEKEELQWKLKQAMEVNILHSTKTDSSLKAVDKFLQDDLLNEPDTSLSDGEDNFSCFESFSVGPKSLYSISSTANNVFSSLPSRSLP
ncbi:uncharacterized protein LOC143236530 isoform X2 [Tachypleus tridentatus]|uniref:uncharacterized protein LOC143236530 isoform X2 n=1 Tax=Tachypleus tridentatus TaxID=6853 RepID=UPI003FD1F314